MDKFWENYIKTRPADSKGAFEAFKKMNQEPRTMDQAALVDDLEPGALKDELLKDFDPSQETYEEYLQRKSLERPFNMADGGRVPFSYAGVVKQGPQTGMHKYTDFYTKKQAKDLGRGTATAEWFKTKKAMNAALKKRKETTGRGLTDAELTKKHKKELTKRGYKTWGEAPDKVKRSITVATSAGPYESQAKWKKEGLKTRVNEETRKLFEKLKPINSKTGLPMTLQEFSALTKGQKGKLLGRLKGKVKTRPYAKRQGWYPEKQANKLMVFLQTAAKKQEKLPLKERNFINVWEGEKFVGVKDKRKNTLWTHVDYDLTGKKNAKVITKHPGHKNIQFFLKQAEKFKYGAPDELLGSYFSKYKRVPTYSEMYQFFNVDPQSAGAKKGKAYKINPLQQHHQELMAKEPAKSIQLTLSKQNTEASRILNQFEKGAKGYSFAEADKKLKELGVRIKSSQGWMGPAKGEITAAKSIEAAQAETVKMFKEAYKNNPKIVDQMTKALNIAKKAKGPGRLKALQYLVSLGGAGFVYNLGFSPTEVQAAEAQAAEPGAAADYTKWMFETGLSPVDRLKVGATGVAGDVLVNKARISKSFLKTLPFIWTPMGDVLVNKLFSDKEPELADFAEAFKEAGYNINSEEFQKQWNSIPEDERKEMLYDWSGQVIDKRSTGEKVLEKAESPWTHMQYAFWKSGVESMQKLLAANPGDSVLKNKLKQHALLGIRMGIPMQVLKTISPIGWTLTAGTAGYKMKNWADENFQWEPLTQEQRTDIQERKTAVPRMFNTFEQASKLAKEQGISYDEALKQLNKPNVPGINFIDFSLLKPVETLAGGGMVGIRKPSAIPPESGPQSQGLASLKKYGSYY